MKYYLLWLAILLLSCQSKITPAQKTDLDELNHEIKNGFRILKIDSINYVYIIYARRNDSTFRIVSIKDTTARCSMLQVGKEYNFDLISSFVKDDRFPYIRPGHLGGLKVGDKIVPIEEEGTVSDLFSDEHLKGLCLFNSEK